MPLEPTWIDATEILIKEVKGIFNRKAKRKEKAFEAIEAINRAANRTSIYISKNKKGTYKSNLELSDLWLETATKVRDLDVSLYNQLLYKAEYRSNPASWSDNDVKKAKIGLLEIKRAAQEILKKK